MHTKNRSLIRDVVGKTVVVGMLAIAVISVVAYAISFRRRTRETLSVLQQSVSERVERETAIFDLARHNLQVFTDEFLRLYLSENIVVTDDEFDRLYYEDDDGAHRLEREYFDGVTSAEGTYRYGVSSFVGNNQSVEDPDLRRRLVLSYRLLAQMGPAFQTRFANTHISYPENAIALFWPEVPWGLQARADLPMNELGVIAATMQDENPDREPIWTGLYFDETAEDWMISYQVPVDHNGRHLINPSHDVPLTDLMTRLLAPDSGRAGYTFIMRDDGYLVARPTLPTADQRWVGQLSLDEIEDPEIVHSYELIRAAIDDDSAALAADNTIVVENSRNDTYLTVGQLEGPDWWYIDVYPTSEIQAVAHGDVPLPVHLDNEIGVTAQRFQEMAGRILNASRELERVVDQRTQELQEANAALREMSIMYGLTGIHNRRSFDRDLAALVEESTAQRESFSLIMIDLDFFKMYNDTYGHQAGDRVLRQVSSEIVEAIRSDDRVYRYGGEELAVLCPGSQGKAAATTAERIVEHVRALQLAYPSSEFGIVTVSAGSAECTAGGRSAEELINAADEHLYRAKQHGRNRAVCGNDEV